MTSVLDFMEGALVAWVQTFDADGHAADFTELSDGLFLCDVFAQISRQDLHHDGEGVKRKATDGNSRLHNWSTLLTALLSYYEEVLNQFVVMTLPDIAAVVKDPTQEEGIQGLGKVILLLLGCAVQCPDRERFINQIKQLDINVQQALVQHIQQVTDNPTTALSLPDAGVRLSGDAVTSIHHVTHAVSAERNALHKRVCTLSQECAYLRAEVSGHQAFVAPPETLEEYHANQDLVISRNKINSLTQEIEEKNRLLCELQEELDQSKEIILDLKDQNTKLRYDLKSATEWGQQAEEFKEKASRVDALQKELDRQRDMLGELSFFKLRVKELSEDNDSLLEAQTRHEEQASSAHKRSEALMDELVKAQMQLETAVSEQEKLSRQLKVVEEERSYLEQLREDDKLSSSSSRGLSRIRSYTSSEFLTASTLQLPVTSTPAPVTISDELKDSMTERVGELEEENESLKEEAVKSAARLAELEDELKQLRAKSDQEVQQKVSEIEIQTKELRKKASRELTREFEARVSEIEQRSLNLKQRVTEEFKQRVSQLETNIRSQQKQLDEERKKADFAEKRFSDTKNQLSAMEDSWSVVKEQATRLENLNKELLIEREEFKQRINHTKEESQNRVKYLEKQVDVLQFRTSQLEAQNARLSQTVVEAQGELGQYISVVQGSEQKENRSQSSGPARIVYIPPSSSPTKSSSVHAEVRRSASSSNDIRRVRKDSRGSSHRSAQPSQRPASVIGLSDPRMMHHYRSNSPQHRASLQALNKAHHVPSTSNRPRSVSGTEYTHSSTPCPRHASQSPHQQSHFARNDRNRRTMPARSYAPSRERHSSTSSTASDVPVLDGTPLREINSKPNANFTRSQSFREPGLRSYKEVCHSYNHHRGNSTQSLNNMPQSPQLSHNSRMTKPREQYPQHPSDLNSTINGALGGESDHDSGCDRSPNSGYHPDDMRTNSRCNSPQLGSQAVSGFQITTSETIVQQTQFHSSHQTHTSEKWRHLVEKVVELQDKNQMLTVENIDLKRGMKSLDHCGERISALENVNLQLELENRKLKRFCESLQYSLTGKNSYDKRTYHFYTNV